MTAHLPLTLVEVFAEKPLTGNLLPVVSDADDLDDEVMTTVARRFNQPETVFVELDTPAAVDAQLRIFTIEGELPFAGHPIVGAASVVAAINGAGDRPLRLRTGNGIHRATVRTEQDYRVVSMEQPAVTFSDTVDVSDVLAALRIPPTKQHPDLPGCVASTGLPALIIPVRSVDALSGAVFRRDRLRHALNKFEAGDTLNCYVVAESGNGNWRARSFALDTPGGEDPATGSAAGPFGAYLRRARGIETLVIDQGVEMGSWSRIHVDVSEGISVRGRVRTLGTGTVDLPTDPVNRRPE